MCESSLRSGLVLQRGERVRKEADYGWTDKAGPFPLGPL